MAGEFGHMVVVPDGPPVRVRQPRLPGAVRVGQRARAARPASWRWPGRRSRSACWSASSGDVDALVGPVVTAAARAGDACAVELFGDVGRWLGVGLANLAAALDPGLFVIGGGVSDAGELLLRPAREAFRRTLTGRGYRPEARIVRAALGPEAGLVGAADLARRDLAAPSS